MNLDNFIHIGFWKPGALTFWIRLANPWSVSFVRSNLNFHIAASQVKLTASSYFGSGRFCAQVRATKSLFWSCKRWKLKVCIDVNTYYIILRKTSREVTNRLLTVSTGSLQICARRGKSFWHAGFLPILPLCHKSELSESLIYKR